MILKIGTDDIEYQQLDNQLWICLSDIVSKIIESKNPKDYMYKIKNKQKINDKLYIPLHQMKEILEKSKKLKTRPLYYELCKLENTPQKNNTDEIITHYEESEIKDLEPLKEIIEDTQSFPSELKYTFLDIQNNYFKYKGKDVLIIVVNGVAWFKGKDVADLLELKDTGMSINHQVSHYDKKSFSDFCIDLKSGYKEDPKTIFINIEGMYDLIMSSRKPEAKIFRKWLSHQVLPSLNKFGSFSLSKKYGNFYDTEDLFEYQNQNVFYVAYIGAPQNEPLFKFGISFDYYRREYKEHKKTFSTFDLIYLRKTDNNRQIEDLFKKECHAKEIYRKLEINDKQYTEIFTINEIQTFDRIRVILDKLIEHNPTKEIEKRDKKIQDLENEKQILETKLQEKEELVIELKKDKSWLQSCLLDKLKIM